MQINYILESQAIAQTAPKLDLSSNERQLWSSLFYLANDRAKMTAQNVYEWPDDFFPVGDTELTFYCPQDKRTLMKGKDRLKELGLIDFMPGDGKKELPKYRFIYQTAGNGCQYAPVSAPVSAPVNAPVSAPVSAPVGDMSQSECKDANKNADKNAANHAADRAQVIVPIKDADKNVADHAANHVDDHAADHVADHARVIVPLHSVDTKEQDININKNINININKTKKKIKEEEPL